MAFNSVFALIFFTFTLLTTTTTTTVPLQLNSLISTVISAGNFQNWATFLTTTPTFLPPKFTLFLPLTTAINTTISFSPTNNHNNPFSTTSYNQDSLFHHTHNNNSSFTYKTQELLRSYSLLLYHIVPNRLSFSDLVQFPATTRLPTLLPGYTLLITSSHNNNSVSCKFSIDGSCITIPDIYEDDSVFAHGVAVAMDYTPIKKIYFSWKELWRKIWVIPTSLADNWGFFFNPFHLVPIINDDNDALLEELRRLRVFVGFLEWGRRLAEKKKELMRENERHKMEDEKAEKLHD